jgi:iron complex transport system ATP-binding protein
MTQAALSSSALSIGYFRKAETVALHTGLNLELRPGEMVCLVGPNGCGKSTLLRTLAGLQKPVSGSIFISSLRLNGASADMLARLRSVVLTEKQEWGFMRIVDLVSMGRYPHLGWRAKLSSADKQIVAQCIKDAGLCGMAERRMTELSDGELQRAQIAKALAQQAPLLLLDEPTAHLDLPNRVAIMKLLSGLAHKTGTAILLSTHELELAMQLSDKLWLMHAGNDICCGIPEELALSGIISKVFDSADLSFDTATGVFTILKKQMKSVQLQACTPELYYWTKRALERNGFAVADEGVLITASLLNGRYSWQISAQPGKFTSLALAIASL